MKPKSSLPHSQVPVTRPYPDPDQSSLCLPILHLEDPFSLQMYNNTRQHTKRQ